MKHVAALTAILLASVQAQAQPETDLRRGDVVSGMVTAIHDGDTLELGGYRLRLANVDAPETGPPPGVRHTAANRNGQPFGDEARARLDILLAAAEYRATAEVRTVDRYGRLVVILTTPRLAEAGTTVNAALVRIGAAWVYEAYNDDPALVAVQDRAREAGDGLWALPDRQRVAPWTWRACQRAPTAACEALQ